MSKEGTLIPSNNNDNDDDGDIDDNDDDDAGVHSFAVSPHKSVAFSPLPPSLRSAEFSLPRPLPLPLTHCSVLPLLTDNDDDSTTTTTTTTNNVVATVAVMIVVGAAVCLPCLLASLLLDCN